MVPPSPPGPLLPSPGPPLCRLLHPTTARTNATTTQRTVASFMDILLEVWSWRITTDRRRSPPRGDVAASGVARTVVGAAHLRAARRRGVARRADRPVRRSSHR